MYGDQAGEFVCGYWGLIKVLQSKDLQVSMTLHKPIINPIVQVRGKCQLRRDADTYLYASYSEEI